MTPLQRIDQALERLKAAHARRLEFVEELQGAERDILAAQQEVNRAQASSYLLKRGEPLKAAVTVRQIEVMSLVRQFKRNKEIAAILSISERTVKFHVSEILRKHGVSRRVELLSLPL